MSKETNYFNLNINGLGYITNVRQVVNGNSKFTCCTLNALSGPTDNADYTRFDVTVAGKDATSLINRCQKSCDEDKSNDRFCSQWDQIRYFYPCKR